MTDIPQYALITGDTLRALQEDCNDLVLFIQKRFGVDLTFNDESITWLSSFIEEHRREMDDATRHVASVKISIFLGCAIIDRYGGEWVKSDENNLAVRFPSGAMAFPFNKTCKQFENGIVDNIYGLYRNIDRLLE
jgi:hypothetical protein